MSTANRVIKNTGFLYAKMAITVFISLYTTRLILNSLGASDFGIFNIVGGAISMLGFLNAAMAGATQRFMSYSEGEGDREKQKKIFNISIVLHALISLLVVLVLLVAGTFFFDGILNIPADRRFAAQVIYGSLIVSTAFTVMSVPYDAVMNAHENMKYYALIGIFESLLKLAVAFVCVYTAFDRLIVYGLLMAAIPLITLTIMRLYCHRHYAECVLAPKRYWDKAVAKEMTGFAGWNFLTSAASMIGQYGLGIVLNMFHGTIANAAQGIANQISGQLGAFGSSIKKALNPVISKSAGGGNEALMKQSSITGTKITFFVVTVLFVPVMVDIHFVLIAWLKVPPTYSVEFCLLLLVYNTIQNLTLFIPQAIAAVGNIKGSSIYNSVLSLAPIVLSYIGFYYGLPPTYMYVFLILSGLVRVGVDLYLGQKICHINARDFFFQVVMRLTLCFALSYGIGSLFLFLSPSFYRLALIIFVCLATYTLLFYVIAMDKREKEIVRNMKAAICAKLKRQ